jgi:hypothetical protein
MTYYVLRWDSSRLKMAQKTTKKDVLIDRLIELAAQTGILHHVPGRIRLKVKLSGLFLAQDLDAADLMKYFNGILDARTNAAARSIVIRYDESIIAPDLWERLVNGKKDPRLSGPVREQLERLSKPGPE